MPNECFEQTRVKPGAWLLAAVLCCGLMAAAQAQTNYQRLKSFGFPELAGEGPKTIIEGTDGMMYGTTSSGGTAGTIFKLTRDGIGYTVVKSFTGLDGKFPNAGLVEGSDGALYGTTLLGGTNDAGTVFNLDKDGRSYKVLHNFASTGADGGEPLAGLVEGSDGALYGTTRLGGSSGNGGAIFKVNKDGSGYGLLHSFAYLVDGSGPAASLIEGRDGALYGTTSQNGTLGNRPGPAFGTVFKLNKDGGGFTVLHTFSGSAGDGANPRASLVEGEDGKLYGTTYEGGSGGNGIVFTLNKDGSGYALLHSFASSGTDGTHPLALIEGGDGILYGAAANGGPGVNNGTVFKLNRDGSAYTLLHSFSPESGDGFSPNSLIEGSDGALVGTTWWGPGVGVSPGFGTVFKLSQDGGVYTVLRRLAGPSGGDGHGPGAALVEGSDGVLYGTTGDGGVVEFGTVFKLNKDGGGYASLHSFAGGLAEGRYTAAALIEGSDGALYGTTIAGGPRDEGTVFKLNKDGSSYALLHGFAGSGAGDGASPQAGLVEGSDGALYGTTSGGGNRLGSGTIFKLNRDGSGYAVLRRFTGSSGGEDGHGPGATLVEGSDGALFGTTGSGGTKDNGTVFKLNKDGSAYTVLHSFSGADGANPWAGLIEGNDGALYGTTQYGGSAGSGTVFKLIKDGSGFTVLHSFNGLDGDGRYPKAGLVECIEGTLFGTTRDGGPSAGTVFKLNKDGSGYTVLHSFSGAGGDGGGPEAGLVQGSEGALYGTTAYGGDINQGTVFKLFSSAPQVAITGIHPGGAGAQLSFAGGAGGQAYNVQTTTNLALTNGWQLIGSNTAAIDGRFQVLDPGASNYPTRFYRSVAP